MSQDLKRDIYISAIAHAIRLGKRPRPGLWMRVNVSLDQLDEETGEVKSGEKVPISFEVTRELLDAAAAAINAQEITYREPKTSVMSLDGKPVPEVVWHFGKKVQKP